MPLVLLVFLVVAWVVTAVHVVRSRRLSAGGRAAWLVATLLLPLLAIPIYWATRPLPRTPTAPARSEEPVAQTLADLIPGWTPERTDACEQADTWARDARHPRPAPSFYTWLWESGLAEKYPACAARLVRTLLGGEQRPSFVACPEVGALTALLQKHIGDADDLLAIRDQLRRLCPRARLREVSTPRREGSPLLD
jgi:hypothetical protein